MTDILNSIPNTAGEIATHLESLTIEERISYWKLMDGNLKGEVIPLLHEQVRLSVLDEMTSDEIFEASENMDTSDVAELIDILPSEAADDLFDHLDEDDQIKVEYTLQFEENQVGRLINFKVFRFRKSDTVSKVLTALKDQELDDQMDRIFVTTRNNEFIGSVAINNLIKKSSSTQLGSLIDESLSDPINVNSLISDLLNAYKSKPFLMNGVVDHENMLIGRITLSEIMLSLREESEHQFMSSAGLDEEEDLFAPVIPSAKRRAIWLGINLLTAFLASWVIGFYEATLEKVVALAVLMPIVASMGGITGSQSLTLVIRGLALDQVNSQNRFALLKKEIGVAILNAILWAMTVAIITFLWFGDTGLSMVIAAALVVNTIVAAVVGVLLPIMLKKKNIDPALSGSVILTTVTDVIGFLTFLGLGTVFLIK